MKPYISADKSLPELTLRGCLLAVVITVLFTAANVYLGLKVGMTFASTIPAAVISMAVLKVFKDSNILENTMVQTFASSAGTLSAIIFTLPGLIIVGAWTGFPFWQTTILCALGGILGVMYSIPLRRALVVDSHLPYPEGVAAAEVLKVGSKGSRNAKLREETSTAGMKDILIGGGVSALFSLFSSGFKILSSSVMVTTQVGGAIFSIGTSFSFALFGAGYLVGIRIALAILLGLIISWGVAIPVLSVMQGGTHIDPHHLAETLWAKNVRFIGVGTIGVAALWAIILLLKPVWQGLQSAFEAIAKRREGVELIPRNERDIPITYVTGVSAVLILPLIALFGFYIGEQGVEIPTGMMLSLIVLCVFFCVILGFIIAAASGYMAGLVGSSSSPLSGIIILAVIVISLIMTYMLINFFPAHHSEDVKKFMIGLVIFMSSIVLAIAAISNDNMQDLKTGQIVGATPWRQQVALLFGVIVGAVTIPPILEVLYNAYGFVGALPRPGMNPADALAAPQAALMAAIASGIIGHKMHWSMVEIGVVLGIALILLDVFVLKLKSWPRLSVLSVGIGIYLPAEITAMLVIGGVVSWLVKNQLQRRLQRLGKSAKLDQAIQHGMLVAAGLIVGESLIGVILAVVIGATGSQTALALVGPGFSSVAYLLGIVIFVMTLITLYRYNIKIRG